VSRSGSTGAVPWGGGEGHVAPLAVGGDRNATGRAAASAAAPEESAAAAASAGGSLPCRPAQDPAGPAARGGELDLLLEDLGARATPLVIWVSPLSAGTDGHVLDHVGAVDDPPVTVACPVES